VFRVPGFGFRLFDSAQGDLFNNSSCPPWRRGSRSGGRGLKGIQGILFWAAGTPLRDSSVTHTPCPLEVLAKGSDHFPVKGSDPVKKDQSLFSLVHLGEGNGLIVATALLMLFFFRVRKLEVPLSFFNQPAGICEGIPLLQ